MDPCGGPSPRRKKSASERRQQRARSDARCLSHILSGLISVGAHRGNRLSKVGALLKEAIHDASRVTPDPTPTPTPAPPTNDSSSIISTAVADIINEVVALSPDPTPTPTPAPPTNYSSSIISTAVSDMPASSSDPDDDMLFLILGIRSLQQLELKTYNFRCSLAAYSLVLQNKFTHLARRRFLWTGPRPVQRPQHVTRLPCVTFNGDVESIPPNFEDSTQYARHCAHFAFVARHAAMADLVCRQRQLEGIAASFRDASPESLAVLHAASSLRYICVSMCELIDKVDLAGPLDYEQFRNMTNSIHTRYLAHLAASVPFSGECVRILQAPIVVPYWD
jgi:hypothetical protein